MFRFSNCELLNLSASFPIERIIVFSDKNHLMKFISSILLLASVALLNSCSQKPLVDDTVYEGEEVIQSDVVEQTTITGSYRSVNGVMDNLSCYCSNGGYVKTANGTEIEVCFKSEDLVPSCDKLTVTGYMTSKSIESNGVCPSGMQAFIRVQEYIIGETDY
jgi:hypothetical protein